ncbi:transporter substrate-binding domain-containing protein [Actinoplanes sp. NPDC024001]|uniref:transporter substrate-binding domain-containing protein n=1 Tax=Actinoplanes sp. NPDC024001 TaxID=3154598 RepID=UPI0033CDC69E
MRGIVAAVVAVLALVSGCGWPRDTGQTLADVRAGVLRVGVTDNPPWALAHGEGEPSGAEPALVRQLAQRFQARVEWFPGSESALMPALKDRVLDLVIGGLDAKSPWIEHAALTRPYVSMRTVLAAPADVAVPDDLAGVRVAVRAGTAEVAAMVGEGADVVTVPEITGREGLPTVVPEWRVAELGLRETGHETGSADHVWAVPPGENAWQVEVERFLLGQSHEGVSELLVEAER